MRRLLLCLPLLSLANAQAEPHHHPALNAHQHGVAQLNIAVEGTQLALELHSPADNLLGFEHQPRTTEQQQQLEQLEKDLAQPQPLFGLSSTCQLQAHQLDNPLASPDKHHHAHTDISASYQLSCAQAPKTLNLSEFFQHFPNTQTLEVQLISEQGQQAKTLSAEHPELAL